MIGTILSVGAAVIFFSAGGGQAFVRLAHEVAERVPFGAYRLAFDPNLLAQFAAYCYLNAIQFGSAAILAFFVADWCLAFLSRVVPQLNVLVLSIQIKAALLLGILAATIPVLLPLVMRLSNEAIRVILSVAKT
ncbi:hypothetical protein WJ32_18490 (plasmid) [Burkholderia ubonensis]|uniref:Type III secretion protein n=1 Tax=Burkholderia ubonensis TaxID=101571 RepID=A0A103RNL6_9BURK|nr:hypothetical protein WJ32_18490 [Burkholderia ubonensis]KVG71114.1 hypothetical protein WJ33_21210 [Burkholderia ubonensis]